MINVQKLRDKINARIGEERADFIQRTAEWADFIAWHQAEWVRAHKDEWTTATDRIDRALGHNRVVTSDMLPRASEKFWTEPWSDKLGQRKPPSGDYRPPSEVTQLLDALDLINEPEISHTALSKVGITSTVMGAASRWLAGRRR
jgi:hypothetical protein